MSEPLLVDMDQALADFRELRELAALQFFDIYSLLREINDSGAAILEVDDSVPSSANGRTVRYKLAPLLARLLTALRDRVIQLKLWLHAWELAEELAQANPANRALYMERAARYGHLMER